MGELNRDAIMTYLFDVSNLEQKKSIKTWLSTFLAKHKTSALPRPVAQHYEIQSQNILQDLDNVKYQSMALSPLPGNQIFGRQKIAQQLLTYDDIKVPLTQHKLNPEIVLEPKKLLVATYENQTALANDFIVYDSTYSTPKLYDTQFPIELGMDLPQNKLSVSEFSDETYIVSSNNRKQWWVISFDAVYTNTLPLSDAKFNAFTQKPNEIHFPSGKIVSISTKDVPISMDRTIKVYTIGHGIIPDFKLTVDGFPQSDRVIEQMIKDAIVEERQKLIKNIKRDPLEEVLTAESSQTSRKRRKAEIID